MVNVENISVLCGTMLSQRRKRWPSIKSIIKVTSRAWWECGWVVSYQTKSICA